MYSLHLRNDSNELKILAPDSEVLCDYQQLLLIDTSTGSLANLELASLWLRECLEYHQTCKPGGHFGEFSKLPTRVIDVTDPHRPFLRETKGVERREYLALSYCWGDGRRLMTFEATYASFQRNLPIDLIPKTFRDAIFITYMFKVPYLWIDALCIIQDDPNDVEFEIQMMGDNYSNAFFTIFAAGGSDSDDGLFINRDPRWYQPCPITALVTTDLDTIDGKLFVSRSIFDDEPLWTRGWVFQEQVLSRRSLFFGSSILSWRCLTHQASETHPAMHELDDGGSVRVDYQIQRWIYAPEVIQDYPTLMHRRCHFDSWYETVWRFSRRNLTFESDKLPALSGLANLIARIHNCTFVAGLWQEDLQVGLSWYLLRNRNWYEYEVKQVRLGPSWSWISAGKGTINFMDWLPNAQHKIKIGAETLKVYHSSEDKCFNTTATEASWKLLLRVALKRVKLSWEWDAARGGGAVAYDPDTGQSLGHVFLDMPTDFLESRSQLAECNCSPAHHEIHMDLSVETWSALLLALKQEDATWLLTCLVLTPTNIEHDQFRRIGLFFLETDDWFGADISKADISYEQYGSPKDAPEWKAGLTTITIV